jgi:putative membrane protein
LIKQQQLNNCLFCNLFAASESNNNKLNKNSSMKLIKTRALMAVAALLCFSLPVTIQAQDKPTLSDPEVASVAVVANQIDIAYAAIAKKKSKDAEILQFAQTMTNDHTAVINQAVALAKKLGVTPKSNDVSKKLLSDAEKTKKMLQSKSGKEFNKAYIDNEVAYHKAVISAVETLLIPETENGELKSLLQNVLPALRTHLEHAEMVQKKMAP